MGLIGQVAITAAIAGASTTGILAAYTASAKKRKGILIPALMGGLVSAAVTAGTVLIGNYASQPSTTSGLGLTAVSRRPRLGLYMEAPTVKKFSSFTGVRYYS